MAVIFFITEKVYIVDRTSRKLIPFCRTGKLDDNVKFSYFNVTHPLSGNSSFLVNFQESVDVSVAQSVSAFGC